MADETTAALLEIAGLLRRRVEQQDEMVKRTEERMAKHDQRDPVTSGIDKIREEGQLKLAEMSAKMETRSEQARQEKERIQDEERQFRQRLLGELERHNLLLERLLSLMV